MRSPSGRPFGFRFRPPWALPFRTRAVVAPASSASDQNRQPLQVLPPMTALPAADAQAVFGYAKRGDARTQGSAFYEADLNQNGVQDGLEYDRTTLGPSPGALGAPDGLITAQDAQKAFSQFKAGYSCVAPP